MAKQSVKAKTVPPEVPFVDDEQVDDLDEANETIPYTYSITSYGADYPVDSLIKRVNAKDIIIPKFSSVFQV